MTACPAGQQYTVSTPETHALAPVTVADGVQESPSEHGRRQGGAGVGVVMVLVGIWILLQSI